MKYYNIFLKPIVSALSIISGLALFADLYEKSVQTQRQNSEAVMAGMAIMPKVESLQKPTEEAVIQLVQKEIEGMSLDDKVKALTLSICLEQAKAEGLF